MTLILIVEDDDAIRSNIVRLLKLEGFETAAAPDNGSFQVSLTSTDKDTGSSTSWVTIPSTNVAPHATLATSAGFLPNTVDVELQDPGDPGAADMTAGLHFAIGCQGQSLDAVTYDQVNVVARGVADKLALAVVGPHDANEFS